jgi:hypothetical protein
MTLTELTALETAYHVLRPLDDTARRRALQWLSDALSQSQPLMTGAAAPFTDESVATLSTTRARTRRRGAPASTAAAPKPNARRVKASPNGTAAKQGGKQTGKNTSSNGHERAYRRMPDPATVMKAYEKIGSISGLAEHFDVPPHTVTHWARRLRAQGYQIGRHS